MKPPPDIFNATNREVLGHLADLSAHSDVAEALQKAVDPLGDAQLFSPDVGNFRYVAAATGSVVFGFACGIDTVAFRLDETLRTRALATVAAPLPDCGPEWVSFTLFRNGWPAVDTRFWALKAYVHAREPNPGS